MISHPLLPGLDFTELELLEDHKEWIEYWRQKADEHIENGDISTSLCLQTAMVEIVIDGAFQHDWREILEAYLTDEQNNPLAYSKIYGERLFKFTSQWKQMPVHAIYTHFWLYSFYDNGSTITNQLGNTLLQLQQPNGWFYNPNVSPTNLITRMKSEYFMSMLFALDILIRAKVDMSLYHEKSISSLVSHPITNYLSSEFFRTEALLLLNAHSQIHSHLGDTIKNCQTEEGYCDFAVEDKRDDYMGTRKRTERDFAIHSAISTLQAFGLRSHVSADVKADIEEQVKKFSHHILENPFDIRAFQIRDLDIPFGTDHTPLELFAASWLIQINR